MKFKDYISEDRVGQMQKLEKQIKDLEKKGKDPSKLRKQLTKLKNKFRFNEATINVFNTGSMAKGWKKIGTNKYHHEHDKTRSILVRKLTDGWEIRFMKELSPGEPPAAMQVKRGYKSEQEAMKVADKMMNQKGSWEK